MSKVTPRLIQALSMAVLLSVAAMAASAQESAPSYAGTWETVNEKGRKFMVTLRHRRTVVSGRYQSVEGPEIKGEISGTVRDGILRFTWAQSDGYKGAGRFTLARDGQSFKGTWSATANPDDASGGTWDGTRKP